MIIFFLVFFAVSDDTELLDNMFFEEEDWNVSWLKKILSYHMILK